MHTGSARPRVIALHASASSSQQWQALRLRLGANYDVVAPDLIGHRRSAAWSGPRPSALVDDAGQIAAMVPGAGCLVGHSFGGVVALQAALGVARHVRSLVLYEPVLLASLGAQGPLTPQQQRVFEVADGMRRAVASRELAAAAHTFVDYWSGDGTWERMEATARATVAQRMPMVAGHFGSITTAHDLARGLGSLSAPTLLLCGSETTAAARCMTERVAASLPNARLVLVPGAGHMGPLTQVRHVNDLIAAHLYATSG